MVHVCLFIGRNMRKKKRGILKVFENSQKVIGYLKKNLFTPQNAPKLRWPHFPPQFFLRPNQPVSPALRRVTLTICVLSSTKARRRSWHWEKKGKLPARHSYLGGVRSVFGAGCFGRYGGELELDFIVFFFGGGGVWKLETFPFLGDWVSKGRKSWGTVS